MRAGFSRLTVVAMLAALLAASPADARKKSKAKPKRIKVASSLNLSQNEAQRSGYELRPEVREFIEQMVGRHNYSAEALISLFSQARFNPTVARLMMPSTSTQPKSWAAYRGRFIEPIRIQAGARFWQEHASALEQATRIYGVPREIIVGIIGVETVYGRNTGSFRVLDALTTLAFDYPNKQRDRAPFFREQLEDYLLFVRDGNLDAFSVLGSYAGAIGIPQFMPGSVRRFAIDFDGDKRIDLSNNPIDAIGSVANFLREHGWSPGETIYHRTSVPPELPPEELKRLIDAGSKPAFRADELRRLGFQIEAAVGAETLLSLIDLPNEAEINPATEYVLGTQNFYALTRYNRSYFYAMSVAELGAAVWASVGP